MKSKEVKAKVLEWLLYRMGYHAAFTEVQNADVYAITRSKYSHEFEIKINKADLMSELNCVKDITLLGVINKPYKKLWKHQKYLGKSSSHLPAVLPNYFSFVVPTELVKTAVEILTGTPYGVYELDGGIYKRKKAEFLHKEKITDEQLFYLLRKASTEVEVLRSGTNYLTPIK